MTLADATAIGRQLTAKKPDPAWIAIALILLGLSLLDMPVLLTSLTFLLKNFLYVLPFLALAVALAAYAKASGADNIIARAFSGNLVPMIILAALIGGLSPFCSCGVIPLIAALLGMGVPLAAVMAFWLASPLMDPSMFFLTMGTLGLPFALAKTAAAVGVGLIGGFGTALLSRSGLFLDPIKGSVSTCGAGAVRAPQPIRWAMWQEDERRNVFWREIGKNFLFLGKWLALAFLLENLMLSYVPGEWIANFLGGQGLGAILVAALIGVPAYLNGYAALPLISGLIEQGMAPGAGMAFLIAGGVSSFPAAIAVFALVRLPVFATYLGFAFLGAVLSGIVFGLIAG